MAAERWVLHIDMNAFYAACHQAEDPALAGKALLVAGNPEKRKGIVLTASYEARRYGVKTAMANWEAKRLCPHATFISPDYKLYNRKSNEMIDILRDYTPVVEVFSIDEAWMDVTGSRGLFGSPEDIARQLKARIGAEVGITCSVGIAPNKLLAKMASEMEKPDGLTVLTREDLPERLWHLEVRELFGVGRKTAARLNDIGIVTIGDLAQAPEALLASHLGKMGPQIGLWAQGIDDSPVTPNPEPENRSVGHSVTLSRDIIALDEMAPIILSLSDQVGRRLRKAGYRGRTVTVSFRDTAFNNATRSLTLENPTDLTEDIYQTALTIIKTRWKMGNPVRLLGVTVSNIEEGEVWYQGSLFADEDIRRERLSRLTSVTDSIRDRFGERAVVKARLVGDDEGKAPRPGWPKPEPLSDPPEEDDPTQKQRDDD